MRDKLLEYTLVVTIACLGLGCAGSATHTLSASSRTYYESLERLAGDGESEIVVTRPTAFYGSAVAMRILINDQEDFRLRNGESATIVVPNGSHTICGKHLLSSKGCSVNAIAIDLTSERAVVNAAWNMWSFSFWATVKVTKITQFPLSE